MNRTLAIALSAAAMIAGAPAAADPSFNAAPVPAKVLEQNRGGFIVADGVTVGFGAVVRTFVDGRLVLQTNLTMGGKGLQTEGDRAFVTADGATTTLHRVTDGQLANIITNTADGRDLRQETDVTVLLPGFAAHQADIRASLTSLRVSDEMAAASGAALGR